VTSLWFAPVSTAAVVALVVAARHADAGSRARGLRTVARWTVPSPVRPWLQRALDAADLDLTPEVAVQTWVLGMVGAGIVSAALFPPLVTPTVVLVAIAGPAGLHVARARRAQHFARALPGAMEQIAAELRGGGSVASAVEHLADSSSPIARDAHRMRSRTRLGLSFVEALRAWPSEREAAGVRAAAGALAVASTMGGHAADAIDGLASSLRNRLDASAEARALSSQARLSAIVVGGAPLGYLAFASVVDRRSVGALVGTAIGRTCLVVGLGLEVLAAVWMRRIVTSEVA
jgi:tight adherence protein B